MNLINLGRGLGLYDPNLAVGAMIFDAIFIINIGLRLREGRI